AGPATVKAAANWRTPTLLLYAGADHLVNPQGSRDFAENAANSSAVKRGTVTVRCFEGMYHELFNELRPEPVFDALKAWLDAKF
ncbi:MAG: alpha/beta hydrolase, partial [Polaromonas sp.]|nr:alpha/beta hydrolase [Polaromonas sp.]